MKWTNEFPEVSGWYWVKLAQHETVMVVSLRRAEEPDYAYFYSDVDLYFARDLELDGAFWLGPLEVPEPPEECK